MRKLIYTLLILTTLVFCPVAKSENIDILPAMQSKSNIQDRVWVGTFQIVWNELIDKYVFNPIKFMDENPSIVDELNKKTFAADDISEQCVYKYAGKVTKNTKSAIKKAIKRKFHETSDILDKFDLTPNANHLFIYAMLKKDFKFAEPFDKLGQYKFRNKDVEFFGIDANSEKSLREQVKVIFYNSPSDFAVSVNAQGLDRVILYKTNSTKPFNQIYSDINKKQNLFNSDMNFSDSDELRIPEIKISQEKEFAELAGKRIKGTTLTIDKAIESVKFAMNNEGVELKSEAGMAIMKSSAGTVSKNPRLFYLNDTFVLFLQQKNKSKPYFAVRVHNIENFAD